jgi:hypothetical protein
MKGSSVLSAASLAVVVILLSACQALPGADGTSTPRCTGGEFWFGPVDFDLDGNADGIGGGWRWNFIACNIPGEDVGGGIHTIPSGQGRVYEFVVTEGPGAGSVYKITDVYDAISVMDQVMRDSGYDRNYAATENYRQQLKAWIINNWMSPEDFFAEYGL